MLFTARSVTEIGPAAWDALSGERPFQSYRWTAYGERVMADCPPFYITAFVDEKPAARGTFYLVRQEPLPLPRPVRAPAAGLLRRWPLLLCRAPLANLSGLLLPDGPDREPTRDLIAASALEEARRRNASFLLFDFLEASEACAPGWPDGFSSLTVSDPGMWMRAEWDSFEAYLAAGDKKSRQHYKRSQREADRLGIRVERRRSVSDIEAVLPLIHNVEKKFGAAPNPWARGMMEHMDMVESTFLEAHIGSRLVGCGLLVYDNGAQMAAALGLAEGVPYVYFALVYESLREAFEKKVRLLRWGSGAYEVKQQLGFRQETNNHSVVTAVRPFLRPLLRLAG
jgi:predicted N-acyltransferase